MTIVTTRATRTELIKFSLKYHQRFDKEKRTAGITIVPFSVKSKRRTKKNGEHSSNFRGVGTRVAISRRSRTIETRDSRLRSKSDYEIASETCFGRGIFGYLSHIIMLGGGGNIQTDTVSVSSPPVPIARRTVRSTAGCSVHQLENCEPTRRNATRGPGPRCGLLVRRPTPYASASRSHRTRRRHHRRYPSPSSTENWIMRPQQNKRRTHRGTRLPFQL